ncbi:excinuclease ABC subunit UvrC [Moraxella bovis]|uniref:excinuclease ABC subunit UvrC n=1 Tax=Moraxella bovis TaxID=476 RepID=UPI0022263540|nr:excinuclease ABC subunit UvrC [Moraxella bovis]UYZ81683.1 excinuclease ABC subunit UvrC [Moraxella bovis]UYZ89944.1 excinuclease ABC subunit UvrC [Moraxella bovis]UYZ95873.1 excinuclease ABC subunit UvrC [Moraxella bovis]UZA05757.1 excinuclease ABC subunit UvrC [Moraxella bovis]UZA12015.1 excinuclease ABC subunit UvrC [Moraxella bovis]
MNQAYSDHLTQLLKNLPNLPGVYKMLGKSGEILYVGKAKSLKSRVNSYFAKTIDHPKTVALVARICDIEIIITRSESEALLLEQNLIKQHRPPYNIILRDDKSYLYLFISKDKFPRLAVGRGKGNHAEGRYFGPYPSANSAKEAVLLLQKLFMLRNCTNSVFANAKRPCLEHQIKRCTAPCVGLISQTHYDDNVGQALDFLNGKTGELQAMLAQKMHESAENMYFEQAVFYRDRLAMLSDITARQAVYRVGDDSSADVFAIADRNGLTVVHVLTVRGGKVLGGKSYFPDDVGVFDTLAERLERFLLSFYLEVSDDLPKEIIINEMIDDKDTVAELLHDEFGKKCLIKDRVQKHRREWQELAILNAHNALTAKLSDFNELNERFVAMQQVLGAVSDKAINRIECFDISHTMGELAVGSCVVFDSRGARKRDYRQYAIHDVVGGDDYGAMRQVLTRRYAKHPLPDLLLIDGGKGQLNIAKEVLTELDKLDDTLLISVAKGEGRKAGLEVLHFLGHEPIDLPMDSKALHLIMHIRDEAHRFAITAHRKKRDKARGASVLEVIPNLGAKRRRDLLAHFGGIQQLLGASESEIASIKGIGKVLAGTIYKSLHG